MVEQSDICTQEVWIHQVQTGVVSSPKPRTPVFNLPRIDTTCSRQTTIDSTLSGSTAAGSSSGWTAHSKDASASISSSTRTKAKRLPSPLKSHLLPTIHTGHSYEPSYCTPKKLLAPGSPPLSARSAALVFAMQHMLSTFVEYTKSRNPHPSYPSKRPQSPSSPTPRFILKTKTRTKPISMLRKAIIVVTAVLLLACIILPAILVSILRVGSAAGQRIVMGIAPTIILLASGMMVAARRSPKEILAMAAVGVAVCQCVMSINVS